MASTSKKREGKSNKIITLNIFPDMASEPEQEIIVSNSSACGNDDYKSMVGSPNISPKNTGYNTPASASIKRFIPILNHSR